MRALNKGWIGIALVILFGASLFFFRGSSRYSNLFNSDNFVANVSGTPISTSHFLRSLEMNIGQFAQMIGEELSGDQIRAFQIHQLVLQNLINNAVFENEFDNLKFILDDTTIAEQTKKRFPNLYLNNKINDDALNSFLRQQRLKIEDLVNIISYETRANIFDELVFENNYPNQIADKINLFNNQTRKIGLIKVPFDEINVPNFNKNKIDKDNSDLINFFSENNLNYVSQEKRDISYLLINKDDLKDNFIPSNNDISEYYNKNKNIFLIPEKRSFKQFNFKTIQEANDFKIKLQSISSDEIESYTSDNEIQFNTFEEVSSNQVLEDLSKIIFSLNVNETSDIVTTTLAHHIIILENITPQRMPLLDEVSNEIKETLTNVQLDNYFKDLKLRLNQSILDGYSLNEIATENKFLMKNLRNISKIDKEEDAVLNSIVEEAFLQNKDFVSDVFDFNSNISFIINVDEIYPSKVQELEKVLKIVVADFVKSKQLKFANEVFEKNYKSENFNNIKNIFNSNIDEMVLKLHSNELPLSMMKNIFDIKLNNITFTSDEDNVYFALVKDINIPSKTEAKQDINLISELKNAFGNEIIKTKNISLNDELINGLLSQYK